MIQYSLNLDDIFSSLADSTRRDIIKRISKKELSVSEIAKPYKQSLAAISKHLKVLENAKLIMKRREGKKQFVTLTPHALADASEYLKHYEELWTQRFDALDKILEEEKKKSR